MLTRSSRLFILEALMSVVCGVAAYFTLPDYPHSKTGSQKWTMNQDMRRLAEARMVADRVTGSTGKGSVFGGVKLCVLDPKTYIFVSTPGIANCAQLSRTDKSLPDLPQSVHDSILRLQLLLPNHGPRIRHRQPHHLPPPHIASLLPRSPRLLPLSLEQRQNARKRLPRLRRPRRRSHRIHHHSGFQYHHSPLHRQFLLRPRSLCSKCPHLLLGHLVSFGHSGEACCCRSYCQHSRPYWQYHLAVLLPREREACLYDCVCVDVGVWCFVVCDGDGYETLFEEAE